MFLKIRGYVDDIATQSSDVEDAKIALRTCEDNRFDICKAFFVEEAIRVVEHTDEQDRCAVIRNLSDAFIDFTPRDYVFFFVNNVCELLGIKYEDLSKSLSDKLIDLYNRESSVSERVGALVRTYKSLGSKPKVEQVTALAHEVMKYHKEGGAIGIIILVIDGVNCILFHPHDGCYSVEEFFRQLTFSEIAADIAAARDRYEKHYRIQ
jgi:hypothetical protein